MLNLLSRLIQTKLWLVLFIILVFRFSYIWISDYDLVGDESYYWEWSRRPDWCYYSKPPMVAWIIGLLTWALGDSMPVIRLGAVLLGTAFLAVFYHTAKAFYSASAASIALLLLLATPANAIANLIMSIDPPVYVFWIATIYYLHDALFAAKTKNWWLAGIMTGLACLSKPVALLLPLLLLLYLLGQAPTRRFLTREYGYYLLPVIISFIPLLIWNAQHDWITVQHSQSHFASQGFDLQQRALAFSSFMGLQLLLLSPITLLILLAVCGYSCLKYLQFSVPHRLLICMGPVPLLGIIGLSLVQKVQANWPMPFYFTTLILLSGCLAEGTWQKWFKPAWMTGFAMVVISYALPLIIHLLNLSGTGFDPASRLKGWQDFATQVNSIRQRALGNNQDAFLLVDDHRYLVSELAFYLPEQPVVFRLPDAGKIDSQYELWPSPSNYLNKNGLIISKSNPQQLQEKIGNLFTELILIDSISTIAGNKNKQQYYIYLAINLQIWPGLTL